MQPWEEDESWDYGLEHEDPMLAALQKARRTRAERPDGDPEEVARPAYASPDVDEGWGLDLTDELTVERDAGGNLGTPETRAQRKAAEYEEETDMPAPAAKSDYTPAVANDEYLSALKKIRERLSKPTPDYAKGYAEAAKKDESTNRVERIMQLLSAAQRRAVAGPFSPTSTNVSGFVQKQGLSRQGDEGELSRLGALARMAKPAAVKGGGKDAGNLESLRAYLVKVGAAKPEEVAGMNEKQLGAVMQAYGLKSRADTHASERTEDVDYRERSLKQRKEDTAAQRALAARGLEDREKNQVADESRDLAGKLGGDAAFEQRYSRLKELAAANKGVLPGLGVVEGLRQKSGPIGTAVRAFSPPTAAAVEGRKLMLQLAADYGREISGAVLSNEERERLNAATIDVNNDDSNIAMSGLETLRELHATHAGQLKKGYRPEAVKRVAPDGGQTVPVRFPNGKVVPVPESEVNEAVTKFGGVVGG